MGEKREIWFKTQNLNVLERIDLIYEYALLSLPSEFSLHLAIKKAYDLG
jgi:hypothetical protein